MQILIDINENVFTRLFDNGMEDYTIADGDLFAMAKSIRNGTPLDLEGLKSDMKTLNCGYPYGLDYLLDCLDKRLGITITEADKGVLEKINEKQDSLRATCKTWDEAINRDGYVD